MLQNLIAGLQGVVDHALVGHFVGYAGNAAIGVGIQIFIVVIVFVISVFSGMGVLVARFAGANERDKVNRTVYQAFLAAVALWGRSEEHTSELQSRGHLVCRLLLEKKNSTRLRSSTLRWHSHN